MNKFNIRPKSFDEFKGKKNIKENLEVFIEASKKENRCLDHILLHGIAGTGKTTLANIISLSLNKKLKIIQGTQIKKIPDLINFISLICENDILFIDEIHALSDECFETLYSVLEDFSIDIKIGKENNLKMTRVNIPNFTLIGATTNLSRIPKPLEERFGIKFYMDTYNDDEIIEIIKRTCDIFKINLTEKDIEVICENSKGIPRIANNLIKRVNDFKLFNSKLTIKEILLKLDIFDGGLDKLDIIYLKSLQSTDDFIGLKTISALTEIEISQIENKVEPFLLKKNYIKKSVRGRSLTNKGEMYIMNLIEN